MHWEYLTSAPWSGGVRFVAPARKSAEAAARYRLHGAVPLWTALDSDAAEPGMMMLIPPCASIVGSGWFGSPWLRMQFAHATSDWAAVSLGTVAVVLPLAPLPVVVGTLATDGEPDPGPPQADSPSATPTNAVRSKTLRRDRIEQPSNALNRARRLAPERPTWFVIRSSPSSRLKPCETISTTLEVTRWSQL